MVRRQILFADRFVDRIDIAIGTFVLSISQMGTKEKTNPPPKWRVRLKCPAITYFHAGRHYHRPHELNGRVRNGNVCFLMRMVTGLYFAIRTSFARFQNKVVKHSSVSTGQLRRLLALHLRPINLVVFQGTSGPKSNETLSWEMASRLYAFSAYPNRT